MKPSPLIYLCLLVLWSTAWSQIKVTPPAGARTYNQTNSADGVSLGTNLDGDLQIRERYFFVPETSSIASAALPDSFGSVINLKQLSSTNTLGGGLFVLRPAAEFDVRPGICFKSSGTGEWVRLRVYEGGPVFAEDVGAVGDGSTDDAAALEAAVAAARATTRWLRLTKATYRVASTWNIENGSQDIGIMIEGAGEFSTIIEGGPSLAGRVVQIGSGSGTRTRNVTFKNISIRSAAASKQDTLLVCDLVGNLDVKVRLGQTGYNALLGFYGEQVEHSDFHMDVLYTANGVKFAGTTNNGNRIFGGIGQNDHYGLWWEQGIGEFSGEMGNNDTAVVVSTNGRLTINNTNIESVDSMSFLVINSGKLTVNDSRVLGTNPATNDLLARIVGENGYIHWQNSGFSQVNNDSQVVIDGNRSAFYISRPLIDANGAVTTPTVYNSSLGITYTALPWPVITEASGIYSASSYDENRGRIFIRQSSAGGDRFVVPLWADSGYYEADLALGSWARWGSNTTSPTVYPEAHKIFYGNNITTFADANSPTDLVITADNAHVTNVGVEDIIYISTPSIIHITGQDSVVIDSLVTLKDESAGTFTYRFYHHNMAGNASANAEVQYYFIVKD